MTKGKFFFKKKTGLGEEAQERLGCAAIIYHEWLGNAVAME